MAICANKAARTTAHKSCKAFGEELMSDIERRALIKGAALSALAFTAGGAEVLRSPRQARAQNIPFKTLTGEQVVTLEALGDTLVPGAKQAGISNFVDQQLPIPPGEAPTGSSSSSSPTDPYN